MTMTKKCSHERYVSGYWKDDWQYNGWTGELEYEPIWVDEFYEPTVVDIDVHRYKCTQCGEIGYYSSYGRSLYE